MKHSFVDLSHKIEAGMKTYQGMPEPVITDFLTREESRKHYSSGTEFHIAKIDMVANTGTYLDSPFHRYSDAQDLSQLPLASIANLEGITVDVTTKGRAIDQKIFAELPLEGRAVLVYTGWSKHWRTEQYFSGHPYLTREAAQYLCDQKVSLVGIDTYNIDDTADGTRPAHSILLKAGIPIVEHLCNLETLPKEGYRFFAIPPMIKGMGSFSVRAFALLIK